VCRDFGVTRDYLRVLVHRAKQSFKLHYLRATRNIPARICSARAGSILEDQRTHHNPASPVVRGRNTIVRSPVRAVISRTYKPAKVYSQAPVEWLDDTES
jgi:hypothetical protein